MADLKRLAKCRGALTAQAIFVHGLGGHLARTWQATPDESSLWPRWLAEDVEGLAVWSVGYEAPVSRWRGTAMHLADRARNVLRRLVNEPLLGEGRIVLIGHSLGGLVIKQALLLLETEARHSPAAASLYARVDKVAFLATPHTGAGLATWGDRLRILARPSAATASLVRNDPNLRHLNEEYRDWANERGIRHLILRETKPTSILGMIVQPDSADPGLHPARAWPVDKDHWTIVKPPDRDDEVYAEVRSFIRDPFDRPVPPVEQKVDRVLAGQDGVKADTTAIKTDTSKIIGLIEAGRADAEIIVTFDDDGFGLVLPGAKAQARDDLNIPWRSLEEAVASPEDYNILDALRWNFGLAETLRGREKDLAGILDWAERNPHTPSARLVTGAGGAGKTRLSAVAASRLRERGWAAGFVRPGQPLRIAMAGRMGLFLILDYPEEALDLTRALLRALAERPDSPFPVRLLLPSRRDLAHWESETRILEGRFGRQAIAAPGPLEPEPALALIGEAAAAFAARIGRAPPDLSAAPIWLAENEDHRLPLSALAAAIHAVLAPDTAFGIEGGAVIRDLAERESARIRRSSDHLGLGRDGLARLLALGVLADGLSPATIEGLAAQGVTESSDPSTLIDRLDATPWWRSGRLIRLQPDRVAASVLSAALFDARHPEGDRRLPDWLSTALTGAEADFGNRLGRMLYDLDAPGVARDGARPMESALEAMIEREPERALRFVAVASGVVPYGVAGFAAHVASALAQLFEPGSEWAARFRGDAARHLSAQGRREDALQAAQAALDAHRDLARERPDAFTPVLATSLNNLGNMLSDLGRREDALAATQEATDLYRDLACARPDDFTPDLATSLNNLGNRLSDLGRREDALAATQEATGLYRDLARARPDAFTPDLATSLNNLGNMLSDLGRREDALAATQEATDLYRDLARARPDAFTPVLAGSLNNLGKMLSDLGRREQALAATQEATGLYRDLARARPDAFTPDLAMSLNNLGNRLSDLGRREQALAATQEAVDIRRDLARARPDAFTPVLAGSLNNLGKMLSDLGRREQALAATQEAVDIRRDLARARPDAFTPVLAGSLNNLGTMLSDLGRREQALAATQEATGLYRDLARARPDAFTPDLAGSLNNLGKMLSDLGRREQALAATHEAVELFAGLAQARPEAFARNLFIAMRNLAERLSEADRGEEAREVRAAMSEMFRTDGA